MEVVPAGKRSVLAVTVPLLRVNGPKPARLPVAPFARSDTEPVAFEGATAMVTEKVDPEVADELALESVVVVAVRLKLDQLARRFATFTEPSPVAISYPPTAA